VISGKRLVGLVPARGGSVGMPRKNVRLLGDKPLIAWTIEAARGSRHLDRVVVSTDDDEIAACARAYGAETPFMRPAELATDSAQGIDVVLHALEQIRDADAIVLLQPTSPFRSTEDIDQAVENADSTGQPVVSVTESPKSPYLSYEIAKGILVPVLQQRTGATNRQQFPATYTLNGAVYVATRSALLTHRSFMTATTRAYVMPAERSIDLDAESDWKYAEFLLRNR
jgi:CMP-N,N'-diacetyllegionaminic acid synthase